MKKPAFVASFLQAIDTKAQLFLGSCASASLVDQVNFGILDFDDEVNKIMLRQPFLAQLPQIVQQMVTTLESPNQGKGNKNQGAHKNKATDDEVDAKGKRKREGAKEGEKKKKPILGETVKNTSPIDPSWIKKDESLTPFHRNGRGLPTMDGQPICLKYHLKGTCHTECPRKASHTDKLGDETTKKLGDWIKETREKEQGKN